MAQDRVGEHRVGRGITDTIMIDVDGTLLIWPGKPGGASAEELAVAQKQARGEEITEEEKKLAPRVNRELVDKLLRWRELRKGTLVIWTMGGPEHAKMAATLCGIDGAVHIGKPDLMIDDASHEKWTAKHRVISPAAFTIPDDPKAPKLLMRRVNHDQTPNGWCHWCPACKQVHCYTVEGPHPRSEEKGRTDGGPRWTFNGSMTKPTFSPSMKIYTIDPDTKVETTLCHYHVIDGKINYCSDHPKAEFKNKSMPLPPIPDYYLSR